MNATQFNTVMRRFGADVTTKRISVIRLLVLHYREAERLLRKQALSIRFRTLDALQLAVALDLHTRGLVSGFVCADQELLVVAAREGLSPVDPEHP